MNHGIYASVSDCICLSFSPFRNTSVKRRPKLSEKQAFHSAKVLLHDQYLILVWK